MMRLRHKAWAADYIKEHTDYVLPNPMALKGKWQDVFDQASPIHIELGMGKGQFIVEAAKQNPDINYIGIEQQTSVIVSALEKQVDLDLPNLKFLNENGQDLTHFFDQGEVDRIYLTFSDPWPKNRHEKRRLTYKSFLAIYDQVLDESGSLHFKTDNRGLFEYSLVSFSQYGMVLDQVYLDLHQSDFVGNIMTEYEEKFSAKGQPIYRVHAHLPRDKEAWPLEPG